MKPDPWLPDHLKAITDESGKGRYLKGEEAAGGKYENQDWIILGRTSILALKKLYRWMNWH